MNSDSSRLHFRIGLAIAALAAACWITANIRFLGNPEFLAGLVLIEVVIAAICHYRRVFAFLVTTAFLWAGFNLPMQNAWSTARWFVLGAGAVAGCMIWMKTPRKHFSIFHLVAVGCVLTAIATTLSSAFPLVTFLKSLSLLLLFLYCSGGARLAVLGREREFFRVSALACEIVVYLCAAAVLFDPGLIGNPNALGAGTGVVLLPIFFWLVLVAESRALRQRRALALLVCTYLLYWSHARAGMAAALVSTLFLSFCVGQFKLLLKGLALVTCLVTLGGVIAPEYVFESLSELRDSVVYKGHKELGILGSRRDPWDKAVSMIREHPYFGSGFGVSVSGEDLDVTASEYASIPGTIREKGSSYLSIAEWVGVIGLIPFAFLVSLVVLHVWRVGAWMLKTADLRNFSVPLAMVVLGALVHAFFEDWLFAVGSYLCVVFWMAAFVLVDLAPATSPAPVQTYSSSTSDLFAPGFEVIVPDQ